MYASTNHTFRNKTCIQYASHKFTLVIQTDKNNVYNDAYNMVTSFILIMRIRS